MRRAALEVFAIGALVPLLCCEGSSQSQATSRGEPSPRPILRSRVPVWDCRVVRAFPHDRAAFTQGLVYANGFLYEGTGLYGASSIRQVELETGRVVRRRDLPARYFGEGIALAGNRLVQLTYTSRVGFVYRADTFDSVGTFSYQTEGWGITYDGRRFIMSDGSARLRMLDEESFAVVDSIEVTVDGQPLSGLNELEFVRGEIFANVWPTSFIARIDPRTGRVVGLLDARGLLPSEALSGADVLNGIAYDPMEDRLFLTGKLWPLVLEVEPIPRG